MHWLHNPTGYADALCQFYDHTPLPIASRRLQRPPALRADRPDLNARGPAREAGRNARFLALCVSCRALARSVTGWATGWCTCGQEPDGRVRPATRLRAHDSCAVRADGREQTVLVWVPLDGERRTTIHLVAECALAAAESRSSSTNLNRAEIRRELIARGGQLVPGQQ